MEKEKKMTKTTTTAGIAEKKKKKKRIKKSTEEGEEEEEVFTATSPTAATAECSFPTSRVRRLAGAADQQVRAIGHEALFLINKGSEMFLQLIAEDAHANAAHHRKKSIAYNNLSSLVSGDRKYEFLSDFVPEKLRAEDALKEARKLSETMTLS